jgi:DNA-binding LytR/AlgR family response regulator
LDRFLKAVNKAKEFYTLRLKASVSMVNYFFIKLNNQQEKVMYDDVLFIEGLQHFVTIHTSKRKMVTYTTMSNLEKMLPAHYFLRVHKSYIIALDKVQSFTAEKIQIANSLIPISRILKKEVMARLFSRATGNS